MQSSSISPRPRRGRKAALSLLALTTTCTTCAAPFLEAQTLLGSHESLLRQNEEAREHDFTYLRTTTDVRDYVQQGLLVRLPGSSDYELADNVSFPYARPEVKTFVERLSDQYRGACGERLVVTSLTRPITRQPANASAISVHPTGMAIDLRRSDSSGCRLWLEDRAARPREQRGDRGDARAVPAALSRGGLPQPVPPVRRLRGGPAGHPGRPVDPRDRLARPGLPGPLLAGLPLPGLPVRPGRRQDLAFPELQGRQGREARDLPLPDRDHRESPREQREEVSRRPHGEQTPGRAAPARGRDPLEGGQPPLEGADRPRQVILETSIGAALSRPPCFVAPYGALITRYAGILCCNPLS